MAAGVDSPPSPVISDPSKPLPHFYLTTNSHSIGAQVIYLCGRLGSLTFSLTAGLRREAGGSCYLAAISLNEFE
jgi:hypothetical protein